MSDSECRNSSDIAASSDSCSSQKLGLRVRDVVWKSFFFYVGGAVAGAGQIIVKTNPGTERATKHQHCVYLNALCSKLDK